MEIILQRDVPRLGDVGDIVRVKSGYARNYLLPRGLAVEASRRNVKLLEHQKRVVAVKREKENQSARLLVDKLAALKITVAARAGEEERLFGSVTSMDIEHALAEQGIAVERRRILLDAPIKRLGTYTVPIHLGLDVRGEVTVEVVKEE